MLALTVIAVGSFVVGPSVGELVGSLEGNKVGDLVGNLEGMLVTNIDASDNSTVSTGDKAVGDIVTGLPVLPMAAVDVLIRLNSIICIESSINSI